LDITVATTPPPLNGRWRPRSGDDGHDLVAVDDLPLLVADGQPVGVAVQGDADISAVFAHRLGQGARRGRAALVIDVAPIGADPDFLDLGAQLIEGGRGHLIGRAIGAIDHHPKLVEA